MTDSKGEKETVQRRDEALKRALKMPPKRHKEKKAKDGKRQPADKA